MLLTIISLCIALMCAASIATALFVGEDKVNHNKVADIALKTMMLSAAVMVLSLVL